MPDHHASNQYVSGSVILGWCDTESFETALPADSVEINEQDIRRHGDFRS